MGPRKKQSVAGRSQAEELFRRARETWFPRASYERSVCWRCIRELRALGTREVFEGATALCRSRLARDREIGCHVLAQLGARPLAPGSPPRPLHRPFRRESVSVLARCLQDTSKDVVLSAVYALGHLDAPRRPRLFEPLLRHPNADVRQGIAFALGGVSDPLGLRMLIELSADPIAEVRSWATFGLGTCTEKDTPAIREALMARVRDRHLETRGEAILGLARRHDAGALPLVRQALRANRVDALTVEAAEELAHPSLYRDLLALRSWWDVLPRFLDDAIEACRPRAGRRRAGR